MSTTIFISVAQSSLSLNYLNIGSGDYSNWNSGIGLQGKIQLKNQLYLLPDIGYFFESVETEYRSQNEHWRRADSYLFANINLAYSLLRPEKKFNLIPYIGAGYYHDFEKRHRFSKGTGQYPNGAPYNWFDEFSTAKIMVNAGVLAELFVTNNVFFTVGCKYMVDIYDGNSHIPYLNAGIGYRF